MQPMLQATGESRKAVSHIPLVSSPGSYKLTSDALIVAPGETLTERLVWLAARFCHYTDPKDGRSYFLEYRRLSLEAGISREEMLDRVEQWQFACKLTITGTKMPWHWPLG